MRDIKFRGKRVDNGEWVEGNLIQRQNACGDSFFQIFKLANNPDESSFTFEVITDTVGQYTGLKDKNEKKIYEGDFLKYISKGINYDFVFFEDGCFKIMQSKIKTIRSVSYHLEKYKCEIIGNIYENLELLKEATNGKTD